MPEGLHGERAATVDRVAGEPCCWWNCRGAFTGRVRFKQAKRRGERFWAGRMVGAKCKDKNSERLCNLFLGIMPTVRR